MVGYHHLHHSYKSQGHGQAWCVCYLKPTGLAIFERMQIAPSFYRDIGLKETFFKYILLNHGFDLKCWHQKNHSQNSLCFLNRLRGESALLLDSLWQQLDLARNHGSLQLVEEADLQFSFSWLYKWAWTVSFRQQYHPWARWTLYKRLCFSLMGKTKAVLNTGKQSFHSLHRKPSRRETNCVRVPEGDLTSVLSCCVPSYKHIQDWKYLAVLPVWKHNRSHDD